MSVALREECEEGAKWIWKSFTQYVVNTEQLIGFIFGLACIFIWILAHLW